jgi:hypothetical protein
VVRQEDKVVGKGGDEDDNVGRDGKDEGKHERGEMIEKQNGTVELSQKRGRKRKNDAPLLASANKTRKTDRRMVTRRRRVAVHVKEEEGDELVVQLNDEDYADDTEVEEEEEDSISKAGKRVIGSLVN